jgi:hypothetical protein
LDPIFKVLQDISSLSLNLWFIGFGTHFSKTRSGQLRFISNLNRRTFSKLQTEIQNKRKRKQKKKIKERGQEPNWAATGRPTGPDCPEPTQPAPFPLSLSDNPVPPVITPPLISLSLHSAVTSPALLSPALLTP